LHVSFDSHDPFWALRHPFKGIEARRIGLRVVIFVKERGASGSATQSLVKLEGISEVFEATGRDDVIAIADLVSEEELKWLTKELDREPSISSYDLKNVVSERSK